MTVFKKDNNNLLKCVSFAPSIPSYFVPFILLRPTLRDASGIHLKNRSLPNFKNNQQFPIALECHKGHPVLWPNVTSFLSYHYDACSFSLCDYAHFFLTYLFPWPAVPFAPTSSLSNTVICEELFLAKAHWNLNEKPLTETSILRMFFCFILE